MRSVNQEWRDDETLVRQYEQVLGQPSIQDLFSDYYYDYTSDPNYSSTVRKIRRDCTSSNIHSTIDTMNKVK